MKNSNKIILLTVILLALIIGVMYNSSDTAPVVTTETEEVEKPLNIVGKWRGIEDERFVRTFLADGTVVDVYNNVQEAAKPGTWVMVEDKESEEGLPVTDTEDPIVKIVFDNYNFYYSIPESTETNLTLVFLERGGVLAFSRVIE